MAWNGALKFCLFYDVNGTAMFLNDRDQRNCYLEVSQWGPMVKTAAPAKRANFCAVSQPSLFTFTLFCAHKQI